VNSGTQTFNNNNVNSGTLTYNNNNVNTGTMTNNNNNVNTSTSNNVNRNENINSGTQTFNNNNNSVSTSTNINKNENTGTMTYNNNNVSTSDNKNTNVNTTTSTNVNKNENTGTMTNNNNNVNASTSTSTNVNQNANVNQNINSGDMTNRNINETTITQRVIQPPPTAVAPAMMSGGNNDLCSTGSSGSVQTQIFGVSSGGTIRDLNCERLKLSKTLFDMGMKVAAVATMCQDRRVFDAMMAAGTPCPYEGKIGEQAKAAWEENKDKIPQLEKENKHETAKNIGLGSLLGIIVHAAFK
jgi:hypothetical protein